MDNWMCAGAVLSCLVVASGAQATTYDAVKNFSASVNTTTSRWMYAHNTTGVRDNNYTPNPFLEADAQWRVGKKTIKNYYWYTPGVADG